MKVKTTIAFNDRENDLKTRKVNEEFDVSEERGKHLIDIGFVKEVKAQGKAAADK